MNEFEELINDYCILADDGAVIFASYDHVLEFVEKIRAEDALDRMVSENQSLGLYDDIESKLKEKNT